MDRKLGGIAFLLLAGCASVTQPVAVGKDTYTMSISQMGGMKSHAAVRADTINKANAYCAGMGEKLLLKDSESSGARGWTPIEATITFQCLAENDQRWESSPTVINRRIEVPSPANSAPYPPAQPYMLPMPEKSKQMTCSTIGNETTCTEH